MTKVAKEESISDQKNGNTMGMGDDEVSNFQFD
jgi:hypothetical protein